MTITSIHEVMWAAVGVLLACYGLPQLALAGRTATLVWRRRTHYAANLHFGLRLPTLMDAHERWRQWAVPRAVFVFGWENLLAKQGAERMEPEYAERMEPEYAQLITYLLRSGNGVAITTTSRRDLRPGLELDLGELAERVFIAQPKPGQHRWTQLIRGRPFRAPYDEVEAHFAADGQTHSFWLFDVWFENCVEAIRRGWQAMCTRPFSPRPVSEWLWLQPVRNWVALRLTGLSGPGFQLKVSLDWLLFCLDWPFDLLFAHPDGKGGVCYYRRGQQVPNFLCWVRIVGAGVAAAAMLWAITTNQPGWTEVCWWSLLGVVITDAADGRLARHMEENGFKRDADIVERGGWLDPVADKIANVLGAVVALYLAMRLVFLGTTVGNWSLTCYLVLFVLLAGLALGVDLLGLSIIAWLDKRRLREVNRLLETVSMPAHLPAPPVLRTFAWGKAKMLLYATGFLVMLAEPIWVGPHILLYADLALFLGMPFGVLSVVSHLGRHALICSQLWALQEEERRQAALVQRVITLR